MNKTLPKSTATATTDTGFELQHKDDWVSANHDVYYTRSSPQTLIGKDNVNKLQVKWMLDNLNPIEQPPIIVGDRGYVQDNKARVIAFDVNTGLNLWKIETGEGGTMHGMTYDDDILFAPTRHSATVVAINATDGRIMWKSSELAPDGIGYHVVSPPIVWKDYVVVGSAGGDQPTEGGKVQGNITALDRTNGHILWNFQTLQVAGLDLVKHLQMEELLLGQAVHLIRQHKFFTFLLETLHLTLMQQVDPNLLSG